MLVNFEVKLKNLDGSTLFNTGRMEDGAEKKEEILLSKTIATSLITKTDNIDPAKAMSWARKLYDDGEIEIEESDLKLLEAHIRDPKTGMTNIMKAPIIEIIDSARLDKKAKEKAKEKPKGKQI